MTAPAGRSPTTRDRAVRMGDPSPRPQVIGPAVEAATREAAAATGPDREHELRSRRLLRLLLGAISVVAWTIQAVQPTA